MQRYWFHRKYEALYAKGNTMSIYSIIDSIRKYPGLYLGDKSITSLLHYLDGYQAAERDLAARHSGELFPLPFPYMHDYTAYRLKNPHSSMGWRDQILRSCDGNEEEALWKFYELYDGFIRVRMRKYWKAVLSEDNIAWNNRMEHSYTLRPKKIGDGPEGPTGGPFAYRELTYVKEPVYLDPLAVYMIELTIPACILAVETASGIRLKLSFYSSPESAKGTGHFPEGAEIYFGPISSWEEYTGRTMSFSKNILLQ